MNDALRLDTDAVKHLVTRQNAVAVALEGSARRLDREHGWAHTPVHREAAEALRCRLEEIAGRLSACATGLAELAVRAGAHADAVAEADREIPG
ncbi:MAG: hypothetical protein QM809_18210 [Gordonia sp. (in: high G+C Gram-positive bacteria)]|uniref:hypothetical protein n=1 Tax=Gordonia sp. (in: high G+C Gram-positive bacteria) TaxID=84139 RepID=UPI0039E592DB